MAISWPFDSTLTLDNNGSPQYSKAYSADVIAKILARYMRNGVFSNPSTGLQVIQNEGMAVLVKPGAANINGRHFEEESNRVLSVQPADANLDRIDTVVLRLNLNQSVLKIDLYVAQGTAAASPTAPVLTRNASVWELGLGNLSITHGTTIIPQSRITDTRLDSTRCGVVASIIGDTDTAAYYAQIQADLADYQSAYLSKFTAWSAANEASYSDWFAGLVSTLGENEASNLLSLINSHYDAFKTLVDSQLHSGAYTRVTCSTVALTCDAGATLDVLVTFPGVGVTPAPITAPMFTGMPRVALSQVTASPSTLRRATVSSRSTTGFVLSFYNGASTVWSGYVDYIAMGT